jgi:hypothetical protein
VAENVIRIIFRIFFCPKRSQKFQFCRIKLESGSRKKRNAKFGWNLTASSIVVKPVLTTTGRLAHGVLSQDKAEFYSFAKLQ